MPGNKLQNINVIHLNQETSPFKTTSVACKFNRSKYKKNKPKVYVGLERLKTFLGFNGYDYVPSGLERPTGVVTFKKTAITQENQAKLQTVSRKRKKPGAVPNQSSIGDKTRPGAAPPVGGIADPAYDPDKGFYENLPFHSMQNPPNKPISVIAPFNQGQSQNCTSSTKSLFPHQPLSPTQKLPAKRNQSFNGFPMPYHLTVSNHSRNFPFNSLYSPFTAWNSSCRPYHSQNFLNRPPVPSIFYNLPLSFQYKSGNNTISSLPTQQTANLFGPNFPVVNLNHNPFSILPKQEHDTKNLTKSKSVLNTSSDMQELKKVQRNSTISKKSNEEIGSQSDSELQKTLVMKKHKCYSPTFHSLRCKKHAKKRTLVYTLPKKVLSEGDLPSQDICLSNSDSIKHCHIVPIPAPRCKKHSKNDIIYQNIAEVLNKDPVLDTSDESALDMSSGGISTTQVEIHTSPKNHRVVSKKETNVKSNDLENRIILSPILPKSPSASKSVDTRPKLVAVSPKKINDVPLTSTIFKNSPTVKICPTLKSSNEIQKGALSIQIQAKIKGTSQNPSPNPSIQSMKSDSENTKTPLFIKHSDVLKVSSPTSKPETETKMPLLARIKGSPNKISPSPNTSSQNTSTSMSDTEIPKMPLLDTSEAKWSPKINQSKKQNAFYTLTAPHMKPPNMDHMASQYSATIPHPKHTKLIPRALFQEQQLPKSKSFSSKSKQKKHFQIPLQKCHSFKFQTAESYFQPIKNLHEENLMKNGYVSDYSDSSRPKSTTKREKHKHKTNGPLVVMRSNDYHDSLNFQENVHLQYPQPGLNSPIKPPSGKPNGLVYADLDMPKPNKKSSGGGVPKQSKQQKHKPKTEYATLQFNDIGQEIDV